MLEVIGARQSRAPMMRGEGSGGSGVLVTSSAARTDGAPVLGGVLRRAESSR